MTAEPAGQERLWRPSRIDAFKIEYGTIEKADSHLISEVCDHLNDLERTITSLRAENERLTEWANRANDATTREQRRAESAEAEVAALRKRLGDE